MFLPCTNNDSWETPLISISNYISYSALIIISLKFLTNKLLGVHNDLLNKVVVYLRIKT